MENYINEQLQSIVLALFQKKITVSSVSLFSEIYMLEPRDVLLIIFEFVRINNIYLQNIPYWEYSEADLESLSDYCNKILRLNRKGCLNVQDCNN